MSRISRVTSYDLIPTLLDFKILVRKFLPFVTIVCLAILKGFLEARASLEPGLSVTQTVGWSFTPRQFCIPDQQDGLDNTRVVKGVKRIFRIGILIT